MGTCKHEAVAGPIAKEVIDSGRGSVVAVFDHSFYAKSDQSSSSLFCIGTSYLVGGPLNVSTTYTHLPPVTTNTPWHASNGILYVEGLSAFNYTVTTDRKSIKNKTIAWPKASTINALTNQYDQSDSISASETFVDTQLNKQLQQGIKSLQSSLQYLLHSEADHGTDGISDHQLQQMHQLIGCGLGLTPSGDDIIIGALITLHHIGETNAFQALSNWVQQYAPNATNSISEAHLNAACRAQAVDPLHNFIAALFECRETGGNNAKLQLAIQDLHAYGHRSGLDAIRGVLLVMRARSQT